MFSKSVNGDVAFIAAFLLSSHDDTPEFDAVMTSKGQVELKSLVSIFTRSIHLLKNDDFLDRFRFRLFFI